MSPLTWAFLLFAFGILMVVVEMFIPSGGVIGFISFMSLVAAIVTAFRHSAQTGIGFMAENAQFAEMVEEHGFDQNELTAVFSQIHYLEKVVKLINPEQCFLVACNLLDLFFDLL